MTLSSHQQTIFNEVVKLAEDRLNNLKSHKAEDYMISIKGAAGTGKTFLTAKLIEYFEKKEFHCVVTAPTHKAVKVIKDNLVKNGQFLVAAKTIHSFLGIKQEVDYVKGVEKFTIDKRKTEEEKADILFVDESSMIGKELFEFIKRAVEIGNVGVVIFVGDEYQLLSVGENVSPVFKLKNQFTLKEIVRQAKGSYIIFLATKVRQRIKSQEFIPLSELILEEGVRNLFFSQKEFLEDFYKEKGWEKESKIISTFTNKMVDYFNRIVRNRFWEERGVINPPAIISGDVLRFVETYTLQEKPVYINSQEIEIEYAKKKYQEKLKLYYWECREVNKDEDFVIRVLDPESSVRFNEILNDLAKRARKEEDKQKRAKLWRGFFSLKQMFAKVQYKYASTIHKLQGSTYDESYVDVVSIENNTNLSDDMKYRLFYVAITRASKDIKLLMPKHNKDFTRKIYDEMDSFIDDIFS